MSASATQGSHNQTRNCISWSLCSCPDRWCDASSV